MQLPIDFFASLPVPPSIPTAPPTHRWTAPLSPAQLIGHALDAGYGAPASLLGSAHTAMPLELQQFMTLRMRSAWKVLKKRSTGYEAHSFVPQLDSTDLGDAATVLGSICARAAFEEWLTNTFPQQRIYRFWHHSVYTHKSVGRWILPWAVGAGNEAPDYLVCTRVPSGATHWYVLEAKGTLGAVNWTSIKKGLRQARRIAFIQVFPGTGAPKDVVKAFCSQAHLLGTPGVLKVTLVDPPPEAGTPAVYLCEPLGVLRQLMRSIAQWEALTGNAPAQQNDAVPSSRYRWAPLARGTGFGAPVELGVLNTVYRSREAIATVLHAMDWLVEALVDPYLNRSNTGDKQNAWLSALEQMPNARMRTTTQHDIDPATWDLITALVNALRNSQQEPPSTWHSAIGQLLSARVPIPHDDQRPSTVADFAGQLDLDCQQAQAVGDVTDGPLPHPPKERIRMRLNGLAVWQRPVPQRLEATDRPVVLR